MKSIVKSLFLLLCVAAAAYAEVTFDAFDIPKHQRASIRHIESGGIGYNQGYTTVETFLASDPAQGSLIPFVDARGHVFNHGKLAANAGIGVRGILENRVYGINAYYDYRNTTKLHFNQIGLGLETLGTLWDFRMNGYLPVGKKVSAPYNTTTSSSSGHTVFSRKYRFAMKGADAEIGFHFGKCSSWNFYAAAGPYYYTGSISHNAWGGKIRASSSYKSYVSLEISDSYDSQFHNRFQGQIAFNFPFGPNPKYRKSDNSNKLNELLSCRVVQPVGRNEIIVVKHKRRSSIVENPGS
jgi:hypothetical protein